MSSEIALQILRDYIKLNNLRYTPQREVVLNFFLINEGHISAEELFEKIHKTNPDIGIATVRRSLNLFVKCKIANRLKFADNQSLFEPRSGHHDHLICLKCGDIIEFKVSEIERLQQKVADENDFKVSYHRMEIYGHCKNCKDE